ncbi:unnamed protein product [Zymoseptoria tritici ST99CH_3D1]|nr:unnamed protein product [Zymoseptoria tritici ST99CH_3D1]
MRTRFGGPIEGRLSASKPVSKLDYDRCTLKELSKFAADRRVTVTPSAASIKRNKDALPLKRQYVTALRQADDDRVFNFLELAPELRVFVYEELLTLQSHTCHPQILATSRQMHREASNILYGDNLIEIRLTLYPVTVNGRICEGELGRRRGSKITWPAWLQRVQKLRIEVPSIDEMPIFAGIQHLEGGSLARSAVPLVAEEGLRNLCEFLAEKHRLRSMRIASATIPLKDIVSSTRTFLYSPRLLGGVRLEYEGDIPELMRNEVAKAETSEVDDLLRNLQANAFLNRELNTFQNQRTVRSWHSKLTDIFTVSAENIWEDLQSILERSPVNLYRKGATTASQPISFLLLGVIADLLELYDEWTERIEIVWDELLRLIGTCMVNLSEDHIMAPAPRDITEDFAELLENYKEEEIDSEDEDVRERIRVALDGDWLDAWVKCAIIKHIRLTVRSAESNSEQTKSPELSDNLVANVMTSFQKIDIEHRAIAFAGQRYFNLLNSAMGRMIGNAPPRSSREDVTRSPTGIGRRLRSQKSRTLRPR